ncbi:MAG: hypothetical protein A2087_10245 [Spirochaetes bacterium GWD1_61_31]|nr:MAG: hypothetical protein A2Y37_12270 [Spirochaetes bacterium GWB1_60_80]OHD30148.1 MAG: hypothetical protein A2004_14135 [Spirochaetes bacterium GWC1_61_12]OHD34597.1 MAG: hypothetical protein A2087_10245 [Spirochaetes bacterium GWD1_61_31]OHD46413.1 MAG: hypothetical protein A2Y35_10150 [Spirochaetes bacterium GWE1_60_18]OHD59469.1 MAG: hypothetical protein A2Y32_10105 [Spirochaetes bacterium GWF1_60_12]HAP43537.1 hypothetical protein [Spirochaetaceae bacterium]
MKTKCISLIGLVLSLAVGVSLITSCRKETPLVFNLEPTPVLSIGIGWGVATQAWGRLKAEPSFSAADSGFVRQLVAFELLGRERRSEGRDSGIWYRLELDGQAGWLHESALLFFASKTVADYYVRNQD